jgi:uncharacterized protein
LSAEGTHEIPSGREHVWSVLMDPAVLRRCLPGCDSLIQQGHGNYRASIRIDHSAAQGSFNGSVRMEALNPPHSYRLIVEGRGMPGFLRVTSDVRLADRGACTGLLYSGESRVGGPVAFFAGSILRGKLDRLIHEFFASVAQEIRTQSRAARVSAP